MKDQIHWIKKLEVILKKLIECVQPADARGPGRHGDEPSRGRWKEAASNDHEIPADTKEGVGWKQGEEEREEHTTPKQECTLASRSRMFEGVTA